MMLATTGRGERGTLPEGIANSNKGTSSTREFAGLIAVRRGYSSNPLLIPSTGAEGENPRDYPASSVNREISHQMNIKQTRKEDTNNPTVVHGPCASPSERRKPVERNQACRARQS